MIENDFNAKSNEIIKTGAAVAESVDDEKPVTLDDCLKKFMAEEKLTDDLHCSDCEQHRPFMKSLCFFRPPAVLTI